ncbi:molybdenum cofactor biosynthesis protein [Glaciecola punicea ACAM 611]|jgi:cyclic pyranopterin phosphate synthase|uniref:GTP 3',8-cyclase n=1 Tax=Glaciecola punicea ACAM 611 TaxID=1121923 RepID=H5T7A7_9ALTE|nr:molybdenum cofactor biosynthesis protein [Glaciecola punicea ACAM 611]
MVLSDKFNRQFEYLRLSVTDVCNFSCQYCLPDGYKRSHQQRFLSLDEIQQVVSVFAELGTKKVRITGGEPCLRSDLPRVIDLVRKQDAVEKIALTTNGFRLAKMAAQLKDAGLNSVNVSIDSFDPKQFQLITGYSDLAGILKGVEIAANIGLEIKLNLVLMKQFNASVLKNVLVFIKDKPITFRFIELMETGDNPIFFEQQHMRASNIETSLQENGFTRVLTDKLSGPAKVYQHPNYIGKVGVISPYETGFCDSCNRLRVSAIGKLHLCLFGEQGYDLRWGLNDEKRENLIAYLQSVVATKKASHFLHERQTGATTHLAMLGG